MEIYICSKPFSSSITKPSELLSRTGLGFPFLLLSAATMKITVLSFYCYKVEIYPLYEGMCCL